MDTVSAYEERILREASLVYTPSFDLNAPHVFHHRLVIQRRQQHALIHGLHRAHADMVKQRWQMQWEVTLTFPRCYWHSEAQQKEQKMRITLSP